MHTRYTKILLKVDAAICVTAVYLPQRVIVQGGRAIARGCINALQHVSCGFGDGLGCDDPGCVGGSHVSNGVSKQMQLDHLRGAAVRHAAVPE